MRVPAMETQSVCSQDGQTSAEAQPFVRRGAEAQEEKEFTLVSLQFGAGFKKTEVNFPAPPPFKELGSSIGGVPAPCCLHNPSSRTCLWTPGAALLSVSSAG